MDIIDNIKISARLENIIYSFLETLKGCFGTSCVYTIFNDDIFIGVQTWIKAKKLIGLKASKNTLKIVFLHKKWMP